MRKILLPAPYFLFVLLNHATCITTDRFSTRNIPHSIGIKSSFLIIIANTAIMPPSARLPVSPMKTWAGNELYQRNPIVAQINALAKITSYSEPGIYIIFR